MLDKYIVQFFKKVRENVPDFRRIPMMQWAERLPLNKLVFHHWRHTSDEVTKEKRILDQLIKDDAIDGDIFKILLSKKLYLDKRNRTGQIMWRTQPANYPLFLSLAFMVQDVYEPEV